MKTTFVCFLLCACSVNIVQNAPLQTEAPLSAVLEGLMKDINNLINCKLVKMDAVNLHEPLCFQDECLPTVFSYFVNQTLLLKPADDHKDCSKTIFARIRNVQQSINHRVSDLKCHNATDSSPGSSNTDNYCTVHHKEPSTFLESFKSVLQQMFKHTPSETS